MRHKKIIIVATLFLLIGSLFLAFCILIKENSEKKIADYKIDKWVNMGDRAQDNCVLICKGNGLKTFPFIFGQGLYLYSIDKEKIYLIRSYKLPYLEFGSLLSIQGGNVYYNEFFMNQSLKLYRRNIVKGGKEETVVDQVCDYAVQGDILFYLKYDQPGDNMEDEENPLYKKNLANGEESEVLKGGFSYLTADNKILYCYDEVTETVVEMSLDTEEKEIHEPIAYPYWIGYKDATSFFVVNKKQITIYDKELKRQKILATINGTIQDLEKCKYKNGYLYYQNDELEFYKVDVETGQHVQLFSIADFEDMRPYLQGESGSVWTSVNYCKDYITIELYYYNDKGYLAGKHGRLLVLDFDGNLIQDIRYNY